MVYFSSELFNEIIAKIQNNRGNEMDREDAVILISKDSIADKIYTIRGQKVMLDFELAEIYGYETKNFNRQVKNNIEKFEGEDFMFRLTEEEFENLRCKIFTSRLEEERSEGKEDFEILRSKKSTSTWGGQRYLPHAFTEQGIYMLMTVLRGELAIKQSRALIRTFKQMKDFIIENQDFIGSKELLQLAVQTNQNTKDISEIKLQIESQMATKDDFRKVMDNFIDPDSYKHFLFMNGNKIAADAAYKKIYKSAKHTIYVVDNYIGLKTLELLREAKETVSIKVFSDNIKNRTMLTASILQDFKRDYPNVAISFQITDGKYHDRYIAIDYNTENETIYHCGPSSKDAGEKVATITRIEDTAIYHPMFDELLNNLQLVI